MGCSSCGGRSGGGGSAMLKGRRVTGRVLDGDELARVPGKTAAYVQYTGVIRLAVRGPRTHALYGEVGPGDVLAVQPKDQAPLCASPYFRPADAPEAPLLAVNAAAPGCPKPTSTRLFAVRSGRTED